MPADRNPSRPTVADKTDLATRLHKASDGVHNANERYRAARARLDRLVAESVSGDPSSPAWWATPGTLTPDEAMGAANLTARQLNSLMERYRAKHPPAPKRKQRKVSAKDAAHEQLVEPDPEF
jgi:hypothetical protein